jgi:hypothetical protein
MAGECKGQVRQAVALVTLNRVLAVETLLGSNLFVSINS